MNILPPIRLANDQVVSRNMIEAFVGTPPGRLLIFTGIALPALQSNGQLDGQEVTVDLNARSNAVNPQFTATVGLASIFNSDSDLLFATDDVKVVTGPDLELLLVCNIAVLGDRSVLNRFSYQATVLLHADNGSVAGTIRWPSHFLVFAGDEHDLFQINAFTMKTVIGDNGFATTVPTVVRVGHTIGSVIRQGTMMQIPYEIRDVPLGEVLFISVDAKPGAFLLLNTSTPFSFVRVSGPSTVTLSAGHLVESPVDFEARQFFGPR